MSLAEWMPLKTAGTQTRYGWMSYYADDQYIGACLEYYGEYSEAEPLLWRKFLRNGDCALDIGANIGVFTLALECIVGPSGVVHAFEAHPENFNLLRANCHGHPNIKPWHVAIGEEPSIIRVAPLAQAGHHNYGGLELDPDRTHGTSVPVTSIDLMLKVIHDDSPVNFMKIDVEGWEITVIRGAMQTIQRDRPIMYVENNRPRVAQELKTLLESIEYVSFQHNPRLVSKDNFKQKRIGRHANIGSMNALCVPAERAPEIAKVLFR